jgi:hypothetical protein
VRLPGYEADHSPLSSAEFKNGWSYTSTPLCLYGTDGDNYTSIIIIIVIIVIIAIIIIVVANFLFVDVTQSVDSSGSVPAAVLYL